MMLSEYDLKKWKKQFPTIVWCCDDAFLGHCLGFADAIGKREQFEKTVRYAAFPTFFGKPAKTLVYADSEACLYFCIYKAEDVKEDGNLREGRGPYLMNGGVIFHAGYRECPRRSDGEQYDPCPDCGGKYGGDADHPEDPQAQHRSIRVNASGEWSVHT